MEEIGLGDFPYIALFQLNPPAPHIFINITWHPLVAERPLTWIKMKNKVDGCFFYNFRLGESQRVTIWPQRELSLFFLFFFQQ